MSEFPDISLFEERDRAEEFCSLVLANGYVPVSDFRDLLYNS